MSKVKVKTIKKSIGNTDMSMNGMFEELMGFKNAKKEIILPKFVKIRNLSKKIYKILVQFSTFTSLQKDFPEYKTHFDEINKFAEDMRKDIYFDENNDDNEDVYVNMSEIEMNEMYKKLKENNYIKQLIVLCGNLKQYSKFIEDPNNLKDNFIGQEPGLSLTIFNFSSLDLKKLWIHKNITPTIKKYVLSVLSSLYDNLFQTYKLCTSPDVDIDEFSSLLLEKIQDLKTRPELHRCENAFRRIEQSIQLLKDNFDVYYRESIASSNPNIIMENFIIDVSNQGGTSASLTREFRIIIQYMNKVSEQTGKNKDPKVQKLFQMLNKNFELMEKGDKPSKKTEGTDLDDVNIELKNGKNGKEKSGVTTKQDENQESGQPNNAKKKKVRKVEGSKDREKENVKKFG